jgi:hypothetical protein
MAWLEALSFRLEDLLPQAQRRSLRLVRPAPPRRLALLVLAITLFFALLFALNSYAAYGRLYASALAIAPPVLAGDVAAQTARYLIVSATLLVGYALAVAGGCVAYLHRLIGPTVALERQVRALRRGDYAARVALRDGEDVFAKLARDLNDLAARLETRGAGRGWHPPLPHPASQASSG